MTDVARIFIKPAEGLRVLKPGTRSPLAVDGEFVDYSPTWRRRLDDGDVVLSDPPKPPSPKAPAKQSKE